MVEVNLKRTFSSREWEKGPAIKDNVIIVEKVDTWPMCALLNIKLQKRDKKEEREVLFNLIIYFIFTNMRYLLIVLLILI